MFQQIIYILFKGVIDQAPLIAFFNFFIIFTSCSHFSYCTNVKPVYTSNFFAVKTFCELRLDFACCCDCCSRRRSRCPHLDMSLISKFFTIQYCFGKVSKKLCTKFCYSIPTLYERREPLQVV